MAGEPIGEARIDFTGNVQPLEQAAEKAQQITIDAARRATSSPEASPSSEAAKVVSKSIDENLQKVKTDAQEVANTIDSTVTPATQNWSSKIKEGSDELRKSQRTLRGIVSSLLEVVTTATAFFVIGQKIRKVFEDWVRPIETARDAAKEFQESLAFTDEKDGLKQTQDKIQKVNAEIANLTAKTDNASLIVNQSFYRVLDPLALGRKAVESYNESRLKGLIEERKEYLKTEEVLLRGVNGNAKNAKDKVKATEDAAEAARDQAERDREQLRQSTEARNAFEAAAAEAHQTELEGYDDTTRASSVYQDHLEKLAETQRKLSEAGVFGPKEEEEFRRFAAIYAYQRDLAYKASEDIAAKNAEDLKNAYKKAFEQLRTDALSIFNITDVTLQLQQIAQALEIISRQKGGL